MVAGRRRYPRSPAHARGRPLRAATVSASTPGVPCPRQGDREWGLRPRAPPPPCRHQRWPAVMRASVLVGQVVRVCDRRPHSRSPRRWQDEVGVEEACEASLGGRPREWAGERIPGPPARAPIIADLRECLQRAANCRSIAQLADPSNAKGHRLRSRPVLPGRARARDRTAASGRAARRCSELRCPAGWRARAPRRRWRRARACGRPRHLAASRA